MNINRPDGPILLDSDEAISLGFTSDKFDGYLWKSQDAILISCIVSKQHGNFRQLVQHILSLGLTVKVPTPLGRMQEILLKNNYQHTQEFDSDSGEYVNVWVLKPTATKADTP